MYVNVWGRFQGIYSQDFPVLNEIQISLTICLILLLLKALALASVRKTLEKIAKCKLGKYLLGCFHPL